MPTRALISAEEYLRTSFEGPDCEFLDGEIVERNLGEKPHSKAQHRLDFLLGVLAQKLPLHILPEIRLHVAPRRYRVPDVAVFAGEEPEENVPSSPPLIVIEIVSRDDRHTEIVKKLAEYRDWGVRHVWLVDPWNRMLCVFSANGLNEVPAFQVPEFNVEISQAEMFG